MKSAATTLDTPSRTRWKSAPPSCRWIVRSCVPALYDRSPYVTSWNDVRSILSPCKRLKSVIRSCSVSSTWWPAGIGRRRNISAVIGDDERVRAVVTGKDVTRLVAVDPVVAVAANGIFHDGTIGDTDVLTHQILVGSSGDLLPADAFIRAGNALEVDVVQERRAVAEASGMVVEIDLGQSGSCATRLASYAP